jgi:hypothetical protein
MKTSLLTFAIFISAASHLFAWQQVTGTIEKNPGKPLVAVTDFRASGGASAIISTFNRTVLDDLQSSPVLNFVPKTLYPLSVPQQPSDLIAGVAPPSARAVNPNGKRLTDWSLPPVSSNFLGFGYGAEDRGQLVVFGWFYSVAPQIASLQQAQVFGKI